MSPEEIARVQKSFGEFEANLDLFAAALYGRLFEMKPDVAYMFRGDRTAQERKLAHMLRAMINGLTRFERIKPTVRNLGQRHVGYGVRPKDYVVFGEALLATVREFMGEGFTPEVEASWHAFYRQVSGIMQGADDWRAELALVPRRDRMADFTPVAK